VEATASLKIRYSDRRARADAFERRRRLVSLQHEDGTDRRYQSHGAAAVGYPRQDLLRMEITYLFPSGVQEACQRPAPGLSQDGDLILG